MLKALSKLDIPFLCTIAGDGKDRAMLEQMVDDYKLQDKVQFSGFVSKPEDLWAANDVFFFPIRWQEPFGLVGLEALAHGVPVVAFDLGGIREYLSDDCGCLVPEKNTETAADMLKQLAQQPDRLKTLGENGLQIVKNKFSEENFVNKFNELAGTLP